MPRIAIGMRCAGMGAWVRKPILVLLAFVFAAATGYGLSIAAYVAYTTLTDFHDREGSVAMGVAFFIGPVAALLCGIVAAVWTARRA
jgi:hypothetical protein